MAAATRPWDRGSGPRRGVAEAGRSCGDDRGVRSRRSVVSVPSAGRCPRPSAPARSGFLRTAWASCSRHGDAVDHDSGASSFAEYAVAVPGTSIKADRFCSLAVAAMFGRAVVTGAGVVFNLANCVRARTSRVRLGRRRPHSATAAKSPARRRSSASTLPRTSSRWRSRWVQAHDLGARSETRGGGEGSGRKAASISSSTSLARRR